MIRRRHTRLCGLPILVLSLWLLQIAGAADDQLEGGSANENKGTSQQRQQQTASLPGTFDRLLEQDLLAGEPIHWQDGEDEEDKSRSRAGPKVVPRQGQGTPPPNLAAYMKSSDVLRPFETDFGDDSAASMAPSEGSTSDETNIIRDELNATIREDNRGTSIVTVTASPTVSPQPSALPSVSPSPSSFPSDVPSLVPSASPAPSQQPSDVPSNLPSLSPTSSLAPSVPPSSRPSPLPSASPSFLPSSTPSRSQEPSSAPSDFPSLTPSDSPSSLPTISPSSAPSSLPSVAPTGTPSSTPSSLPSSSPTLECHDEPHYQSPINGFVCKDHVGTSCLQWRYLGLTLDSLEDLIISCPVSCDIDCGTLNRFANITISYQISKVPGLLDAITVDDLNSLTRDYLADFLIIQEPFLQFFIDEVELLSQSILSRKGTKDRGLAEESVNLWVTVAIRGFAFGMSSEATTELLVSGIDSLGYTNAIQNSGNIFLEEAFAFSAAEKADDSVLALIDDYSDEEDSESVALVAVVVVCVFVAAFSVLAYVYHKRSANGLPCCRFRRNKIDIEREREVQSPESQGLASHVGSMFSFDDTATAGTNGLMRFISSFSRSRDSTSQSSSVQPSPSHDDLDDLDEEIPDEELGVISSQSEEESSEEEPHPLTGIIPPMVVYDFIDEEGGEEIDGQPKNHPTRQRAPSVVPSRRVDASSEFIAALGNRNRPSATNDLAEYLSETSNFVTDPSTLVWNRLESGRPSPIGIVVDSDDDVDDVDDDASVASTPVRRQESLSDTNRLRRTKSLDDCSILESLSDIILTEKDFSANISPIELPGHGNMVGSPVFTQGLLKTMTSNDSPRGKSVSPDEPEEPGSFTWVRGSRTPATPETPITPWGNASQPPSAKAKSANAVQEPKNSFWNRSPIAKGVKDAIWKRHGAPATPTRTDLPPSTPTRNDPAMRRASMNGWPSTPTRTDLMRRSSSALPPSTPTNRPEKALRRSSTPTRLEAFGRRIPTPTKGEQTTRRHPSPPRTSVHSNSEESQGESRRSLSVKSRSASFSTGHGSSDEEVNFEFRAPRFGKLGLLINSSPQTGPMVEQVKDYSTLFGRVLAGDRIVEVDGVEASQMTIKEVTKRLAGKYGIRAASNEVRIKIARVREREWNDDDDRRSVNSNGSSGVDSFSSSYRHRRNQSEPEPLLDRLSLDSHPEHQRLSSYSISNHSKSGEEV